MSWTVLQKKCKIMAEVVMQEPKRRNWKVKEVETQGTIMRLILSRRIHVAVTLLFVTISYVQLVQRGFALMVWHTKAFSLPLLDRIAYSRLHYAA